MTTIPPCPWPLHSASYSDAPATDKLHRMVGSLAWTWQDNVADLATLKSEPGAETDWHEGRINELARIRRQLDEVERIVVAEAREAGVTWQAIGAQYGITRQAAQMRFGK